jgi:hypothetical protein
MGRILPDGFSASSGFTPTLWLDAYKWLDEKCFGDSSQVSLV